MSVRQSSYQEKHGQWTKGQITRDDDDIRFDSYMTDPAAASTLIGFGEAVVRKANCPRDHCPEGHRSGRSGRLRLLRRHHDALPHPGSRADQL